MLSSDAAASEFLQQLVGTRYLPWSPAGFPLSQWCGGPGWEATRCPQWHDTEADEDALGIVHTVAKALDQLRVAPEEQPNPHRFAIMEIILGDYVERVSTYAIGIDRACLFIRCLGHSRVTKPTNVKATEHRTGD